MVIGSGREEHFVIRPSRIDVIIFSSEVLLATDSYHLNSVGIPVDLIKLLENVCLWLDGVNHLLCCYAKLLGSNFRVTDPRGSK